MNNQEPQAQDDKQRIRDMLTELVSVTVAMTHAANSRRGISKTLLRRERRALDNLYMEMTGEKLTDAQVNEISG